MDEKEDDISIDFSKVKNFFKKGKKSEVEVSAKSDEVVVDVKEEDREIKVDVREKSPRDVRINIKDDEDDISVDFSKIKNFFSSGKKEEKQETLESPKDDELSLDFGKFKRIFKSDSNGSKEDFDFDWGKAKDFSVKYGIVLLALIPIILSIYVRVQAGSLAFTDNWASDTIINGIRSNIRADIDRQFPNLPDATKSVRADIELQNYINNNRAQIDQAIRAYSNEFKKFFQDENGNNYMPDIDPYYWVRYAENIDELGHPGDIIRDGVEYDDHQLAPIGRPVAKDTFHSYSIAYFYKIVKIFVPSITLFRSSFYLPVVVSALCVLIVFLVARKISGTIGGFFAGMMMAVNAAFLGRTLFGHADNDIWVIFFPLVVTWLFITTIEVKSIIKIIVLSVLAGLFTGMFTLAWTGWWYIFDFLIITMGVTFIYLVLANFSELRKNPRFIFSDISMRDILIFAFVYVASSALFVTAFSGWGVFQNSVLGPLGFTSIKDPVQTLTIWPNVLTTVAELNEGSLNGIIQSMGGAFLFFIGLVGLLLAVSRTEGIKRFDLLYILASAFFYAILFIKVNGRALAYSNNLNLVLVWILIPIALKILISLYKRDKSYDFKLSILLGLWFVFTIFASIRGIRFTLLLAPAFSVAFGVALGKFYAYSSRFLSKEFKIHKIIAGSVLILLLLYLYVSPTRAAIGNARSDIPIINDAWYNSLKNIQKGSKEDAIITSWWDFGHHFKYIADRHVTFDGTTQTAPPAHWVGKLFMIDEERRSVGILRMLNCGSNSAFWAIHDVIQKDDHAALKILNEIIVLDKDEAALRLRSYGFNEKQAENVLKYTHCDPPESFVIASSDMSTSSRDMDGGKSGVWSHFGSWNFERADIWRNVRNSPQEESVKYMMDKFNYTKEYAENIYFEVQAISSDSEANTWIAPWPGFGGTVGCSKRDSGIFVCGNGLQVNLSSYDVFGVGENGIVRPKVVAFVTEKGMMKKEFNGTTLDFGFTVIPRGDDSIEGILSSKELAGSMFVRMYKTKGHGLKYFKLFDEQHGFTGTNIYTYKVDWEGRNVTIVDDFVKKPKEEPKTEVAEEFNLTSIEANTTSNIS